MGKEFSPKPYPLTPLRVWGPLVFWLVMIFIFSSFHKTPIPHSKIIPWDKMAHTSEYAILGYLAARALCFSRLGRLKNHYILATMIFGLLYGLGDEFHQSFVPGRDASVWDATADFVGATLGSLIFHYSLLKGRFNIEESLSVQENKAERNKRSYDKRQIP